jgi:transcriptional regulator with XRE-family HTH domain
VTPESIKDIRSQLGLTQQAFADLLGVTFATINRWENGKAKPQRDRIERIRALAREQSSPAPAETAQQLALPPRLDFEGSPQAIKLVVDACRLQKKLQELFKNLLLRHFSKK